MEIRFKLEKPQSMLKLILELISQGRVLRLEYEDHSIFIIDGECVKSYLSDLISEMRPGSCIVALESDYSNAKMKFIKTSDGVRLISFGGQEYTVTGSNVVYRGAFRAFLSQGFFPRLEIAGKILDSQCRSSLVQRDLTLRQYCVTVRAKLLELYQLVDSDRANPPYPKLVLEALKDEGLVF